MIALRALGYGLFGFIPLVLWLFVAHPEPIGLALAAGVVLMVGHRFLARPYMNRVRSLKCLWCNRMPLEFDGRVVALRGRAGTVEARCCPHHEEPLRRFFTFLIRWGPFLAVGIFLPLLGLLGSLAAAALGYQPPLGRIVPGFQLVVGLTVSVAAWGYRLAPPSTLAGVVPFPVHNFFLLGVRSLLWVFRLVGAVWIWRGLV